jgi:hypothetical protein
MHLEKTDEHLSKPCQNLILGKPLVTLLRFLDEIEHVATLAVVHDYVEVLLGINEALFICNDIWMPQLFKKVNFLLSFDPLGITEVS